MIYGIVHLYKRRICITSVIVLMLAVAVTGVIYHIHSSSYLAEIAGEKITVEEYIFLLDAVKQEIESEVGKNGADIANFWSTTKIDGKNVVEVLKERALESAKELKIQLIRAKENKIVLDKNQIDKINSSVDSWVDQYGNKGKTSNQTKKAYNINMHEYKALYRQLMLVNKYAEEEQNKIPVSDKQAKEYYEFGNHRDRFDKVHVKDIYLPLKDSNAKDSPADKEKEIRRKADNILASLIAGVDMDFLAKQYSKDVISTGKFGEYIFDINGEYDRELKDWAFKAKAGEIGIVKTEYGYHVVKLMKRTTFDEVKDVVRKAVQIEEYKKKLENWKKDPKYNVIINEKVFKSIKME